MDEAPVAPECSVERCGRKADYEVFLYDYYQFSDGDEEFFKQDYTCPFLCAVHMEENERKAEGDRVPRGFVAYPYSNRHGAQGYTKYQPLSVAFSPIVDEPTAPFSPGLLLAYRTANDELIRRLAQRPDLLHGLEPRKFEELIADIFARQGFQVELTPATRDGGCDVRAMRHEHFGTSLYLIECKRYAPHRRVGVEIVRGLHGVTVHERATMGIVATTSTFSRDAIAFASPLQYQLSLRDFHAVTEWLKDFQER